MRGLFFDITPEIFNRIVIGRITGQLEDGEAVGMLSEELLGFLGGMVGSTILYQENRYGGLFEERGDESDVAIGIEAPLNALIKELPGKEINQAEGFVAFALTGGFDSRLLTFARPGITERPPLGKTSFIAE